MPEPQPVPVTGEESPSRPRRRVRRCADCRRALRAPEPVHTPTPTSPRPGWQGDQEREESLEAAAMTNAEWDAAQLPSRAELEASA